MLRPVSLGRSLPASLRLFVVCVCLAATGMYAVTTWHAREVAIDSARRESNNLADSLAQQADDTVEVAEGALAEIVGRAEMEGFSPEARVLLNEDMAQTIVAMPRLHMLLIADDSGRLLLDATSSASRGDVSFRDLEYFRYHQSAQDRSVLVTGPVRSNTDGTWVLNVTRRIDHTDGRFAGVAVAQIALDYFVQSYAGIDIGHSGAIALVRENGTVLAHYPSTAAYIGRSIADSALFRPPLRDASAGIDFARSPLDGVKRINVFQRVEHYRLLVIVGLSDQDFLINWRADAVRNAIATVVIVAMIAGLGTYLTKQIEQRQTAEESLANLALIDGLTGIANRRHLDDVLKREWSRANRDHKPLAALMIDVDYFKDYNDRYGHAQGDTALRSVAATLTLSVRPTDFVARYGGEEFTVILPATSAHDAVGVAERIRSALTQQNIPHAGAALGAITVSIGAASLLPTHLNAAPALIEAADAALYQAKRLGRNRSAAAQPSNLAGAIVTDARPA